MHAGVKQGALPACHVLRSAASLSRTLPPPRPAPLARREVVGWRAPYFLINAVMGQVLADKVSERWREPAGATKGW